MTNPGLPGFGDLAFETDGGKWFACIWIIVATYTTVQLLSNLSCNVLGNEAEERILDAKLDETFFQELDESGAGNGTVNTTQWMCFVLEKAGYVDRHTMQEIKDRFDELDVYNEGVLSHRDIIAPHVWQHVGAEGAVPRSSGHSGLAKGPAQPTRLFRSTNV